MPRILTTIAVARAINIPSTTLLNSQRASVRTKRIPDEASILSMGHGRSGADEALAFRCETACDIEYCRPIQYVVPSDAI